MGKPYYHRFKTGSPFELDDPLPRILCGIAIPPAQKDELVLQTVAAGEPVNLNARSIPVDGDRGRVKNIREATDGEAVIRPVHRVRAQDPQLLRMTPHELNRQAPREGIGGSDRHLDMHVASALITCLVGRRRLDKTRIMNRGDGLWRCEAERVLLPIQGVVVGGDLRSVLGGLRSEGRQPPRSGRCLRPCPRGMPTAAQA
jgi:hypothetical protein